MPTEQTLATLKEAAKFSTAMRKLYEAASVTPPVDCSADLHTIADVMKDIGDYLARPDVPVSSRTAYAQGLLFIMTALQDVANAANVVVSAYRSDASGPCMQQAVDDLDDLLVQLKLEEKL